MIGRKRVIVFLMIATCVLSLLSCNGHVEEAVPTISPSAVKSKSGLFGMIIPDGSSDELILAMHSFLVTCENADRRAKLYRVGESSDLAACVNAAKSDNCDAVIVCSCDNVDISPLNDFGIVTLALMCEGEGYSARVSIDEESYRQDACMLLCEKATANKSLSGSLVVYGNDPTPAKASFDSAIKDASYDYKAILFERTDKSAKAAGAALAEYMTEKGNVCGVFATRSVDAYSAVLAARATEGVQTVIGVGMSETNIKLLSSDLYAVCVRPVYDAAAQAVLSADSIVRGDSSDTSHTLQYNFVTAENLDKYLSSLNTAKKWFGIDTGIS